MNKSFAATVILASALTLALPAVRGLAQGVPSQADIERSLGSGGPPAVKMRGITPGAISRFPTDQDTAPVSTTAPSYGTNTRPNNSMYGGTPQRQPTAPMPTNCTPPAPQPGTISLPQITFEFNSMTLTPQAKATLTNLGKALNEGLKDKKLFVIEGHTDAVGSAQYNMELSRQRAEAAKDFLVSEMKVDAERLKAVGKGFSELVDPCHPRAAENRRIVVINASS